MSALDRLLFIAAQVGELNITRNMQSAESQRDSMIQTRRPRVGIAKRLIDRFTAETAHPSVSLKDAAMIDAEINQSILSAPAPIRTGMLTRLGATYEMLPSVQTRAFRSAIFLVQSANGLLASNARPQWLYHAFPIAARRTERGSSDADKWLTADLADERYPSLASVACKTAVAISARSALTAALRKCSSAYDAIGIASLLHGKNNSIGRVAI